MVWWWCSGGALSRARLAARSIAATQPALSDRSRRHQVHCCVRQYSRKYPAQGGRSGRIDSHPPRQISWEAVESGSCRRPRPTPPFLPSRRSPFLCVSGGASDQSCRWCLAMTMYVASKSQVHGWRRSPQPRYLGHLLWFRPDIGLDQTGNGNTQRSGGVPVSPFVCSTMSWQRE